MKIEYVVYKPEIDLKALEEYIETGRILSPVKEVSIEELKKLYPRYESQT